MQVRYGRFRQSFQVLVNGTGFLFTPLRENCTHGFLKFYFKCVHFLAHSTIVGLGPGAVGMTGLVGAGV